MIWILLLTAMHVDNPKDVPATMQFEVETEERCIALANTFKYELKFKQYKIEASCYLKK